MSDPSKPLKNAKHELFVQNRVSGMTMLAAHGAAGYKANAANAAKITRKDNVRARMDYLMHRGAETAGITAGFVLDGLRDNYLRATGQMAVNVGLVGVEGEPILNEDGTQKVGQELVRDLHAGNKALELLGKHLGVFEEKETGGSVAVTILYPLQKETHQIIEGTHDEEK